MSAQSPSRLSVVSTDSKTKPKKNDGIVEKKDKTIKKEKGREHNDYDDSNNNNDDLDIQSARNKNVDDSGLDAAVDDSVLDVDVLIESDEMFIAPNSSIDFQSSYLYIYLLAH